MKRYTEEKERLEKKKEEIRGHLAQLRKEKRELKETLLKCTGKGPEGHPQWGGTLSSEGCCRLNFLAENLAVTCLPNQWALAPSTLGLGGCSLCVLFDTQSCLKGHSPGHREKAYDRTSIGPAGHCEKLVKGVNFVDYA